MARPGPRSRPVPQAFSEGTEKGSNTNRTFDAFLRDRNRLSLVFSGDDGFAFNSGDVFWISLGQIAVFKLGDRLDQLLLEQGVDDLFFF